MTAISPLPIISCHQKSYLSWRPSVRCSRSLQRSPSRSPSLLIALTAFMARACTDHADADARNRLNGIGWSTSIQDVMVSHLRKRPCYRTMRAACSRCGSFGALVPPCRRLPDKCFGPQTRGLSPASPWFAFQHTQARRRSRSRSTAHRRYKCSTSLLVTRCGQTFEQQQQRMHRGCAQQGVLSRMRDVQRPQPFLHRGGGRPLSVRSSGRCG